MTKEDFLKKARTLGFTLTPQKEEGWYVVENYYFSNYKPDAKLYVEEESASIEHVKGFLNTIHFPEELITFNYYEYYLPKKEKFPDLVPTIFWEDKYQEAGLLDSRNEEFKTARRKTLLHRLEDHFSRCEGLKELSFWEALAKEFPECIYTGPAFRAVAVAKDQLDMNKLKEPGFSWAIHLQGVKEFVVHGDSDNFKYQKGFYLASGTVQAISLVHIKVFLGEEYKKLVAHPSDFKEDEIIVLEVLSLHEVKYLNSSKEIT